jgi:hypothetical protein
MSKTPLAAAKEKFGDKAKLIAAVEVFAKNGDLWLGRTNEDKGLAHVSNAKLLRLHATFTTVKEKFGTRAKLISAIVDLEKRAKDEGFKKRLEAYPVPRLYDLYLSTEKRLAPKKPVVKGAKKAAPPAKKVVVKVALSKNAAASAAAARKKAKK